jgi:gas vesicle protein
MSDKDTGSSFFMGFILGVVAGTAIGLLYAPKRGAETRELLKEKTESAAEKAKEVAAKVKEAAVSAEKRVEEKLGSKKVEE